MDYEAMSRRSMRLLTNGYYEDSSSSHEVSYRESPVRVLRSRTVPQRQTLSGNGSQGTTPSRTRAATTPCLSFSSLSTDESCRGVASALRAAVQSWSCHGGSTSGFSVSSGASLLATSGYSSSSEESETSLAPTWRKRSRLLSRRQRTSFSKMFCGDAEDVETSLTRVLFAGLFLLCCSLFGLLRDVLLFISSCTHLMRKSTLTVLTLTLLATGFWFWYPAVSSLLMTAEPVWSASSTSTFGMNTDPRIVTNVNVLHQQVLDQINQRDAIWKETWTRELNDVKRKIDVLKKDTERHRHMSKRFQMEMANLKDVAKNNDLDWQTKMTGEVTVMAKNVAELKNSVSHLYNDNQNLNQRMTSQEDTNAQLKKKLTDWIKEELQRRVGQDTGSILLRPELQEALEALERRLLQRLSEIDHNQHGNVWKTVGETLQKEGLGAITVKDVHEIVERALSLYKADGTGMADYALESLGASVIESQSSETYHTRSSCISLFGIPLWYTSESPRTVIQPEVHPGKCWAFRGSQGFVTISLSLPVRVTHVTLEHIPKSLSPTGRIDSAPREFAVYGLSGFDEQEEGDILGIFTYDSDGGPIQTFQLPDSVKGVYRAVQLRVLSNWGNPEYSCVYRFRVHGQTLPC